VDRVTYGSTHANGAEPGGVIGHQRISYATNDAPYRRPNKLVTLCSDPRDRRCDIRAYHSSGVKHSNGGHRASYHGTTVPGTQPKHHS
jgi:hypothetical protein